RPAPDRRGAATRRAPRRRLLRSVRRVVVALPTESRRLRTIISLARGRAVDHPERMTRSQLIEIVAAKMRLDHAAAERAVRAVFDAMEQALGRGEGIELRGFGSFAVR